MTRDDPRQCLWCGKSFVPQSRRGPEQVFCSSKHRRTFWGALRKWGYQRFLAGDVSIADLDALRSTHGRIPCTHTSAPVTAVGRVGGADDATRAPLAKGPGAAGQEGG